VGATGTASINGSRSGPAALAATKFVPPHAPEAMVHRARLTARLDAGVREPLTLVAGPAGAGKSALLSSWAASRTDGATAWLSLDPLDADRRRFWRGVLEALRRAGLRGPVAELEVQPSDDGDLILPALVNALECLDEPVVLVLEDLHEIGDAPALRDLDRLLRHPSPALRLVISTRVEPPLRVGRLRVTGELSEIRDSDLTFTLAETEQLLQTSGIDVAAETVATLWERTEGWAAGLRLAAMTMRAQPDPVAFVADFAGDDSAVADYLLAEILAQQPPDIREYLLRISIVAATTAELADELTGRTDSARVLAGLARDHALLASSGEGRAWHRLHPLFAEMLRSELRHRAPDDVPELHRRAARWFEAHGRPTEALEHAAAGRDWQHVGALAAAHWVPMLLEGELGELGPVLERMPDEQRRSDPEVTLAIAGVHVSAGDEPGARHWFELARAGRGAVPADRRRAFDLALAAVGLMRGRLRGDIDAATQHAQTMFERDGDYHEATAGPDDLRALALTELGIAELWIGDLDRARRDLEAARGAAAAARRDWLVVLCMAYLGTEALVRGRYERAKRLATEAEALAHQRGWCGTWPVGITAGTLAAIAFHRDRLDESEQHLRRAADRLKDSGDRPLRAVTAFQQARLQAAQGQPEQAFETLQEARWWLRDWPIMPAMPGVINALEATLLAAMGDDEAAAAQLTGDGEEAAVARARLRLRAGDPAGALAHLEPFLGDARMILRPTRTEAWVVAAVARDALGDAPGAGEALEQALETAELGGIQRAFLMHGSSIAPLLHRHGRNGTSHRALLEDLIAAVDRHGADRPIATLPDALSDREAAVLRYLPTMMSNQEIAGELFVSVNTVKTHLKAIYRKLDVEDRRSAVRRARELSLIGPP
jgi:LuxR family maltose regulon positive regulatory protein